MRGSAECATPPGAVVSSRRPIEAEVISEAARAFGLDVDGLSFVRDVANIVYVDGVEPHTRFLRFTHRDDHAESQIHAEIEWLHFLVGEGLPVCRPLPARDGRPVVRASGDYTAVLIDRVRGQPVSLEEFCEPVFEQMGAFLGRLHRVSADFVPGDPARVRPHWRALDDVDRVVGSWPGSDVILADAFRAAVDRLSTFAVSPERYGLIHADLHRGNIFLHDDGIDVFDFDDSCYAFLVADIANAVYYSLFDYRYLPEDERSRRADEFLGALLRGYRREHGIDDADLALIPDLLEYRELAVDAFSHRRHQQSDDATRKRWRHVRDRIARGAPYVKIDLA
jgi:Ser/Thr protein kinase RdoA (MazF antagonist)